MIFQAFLVDSLQAENLVKQKIWQCQVSNSFEIGTVDLSCSWQWTKIDIF